jgi:para-nitrobenzyl esterase
MDQPVSITEYGHVRGVAVTPHVSGFFGIPYAAPPVGGLRWRPTARPDAWSGVREAAEFGPDPIQPKGMRTSRAPCSSEDCLYLNIWAPQESRQGGWPVLIWSCGGAFTTGGGAFAEEDPANLAARGAVVVSFNIRLNIFGFFAHPALSAESPHGSSGNYGLLDQAAAFAWIRANIGAFGGDSDRLTFFGESAGATISTLLLSSPLVHKPYDRTILMSPGSFSALLPLAEAERHGAALGDTAEEMRAIPADELLQRAASLPAVRPSLWLARPLRPIVDGWVIRSDAPLTAGHFDAVPAIIGTNEDEGRFFGPRMGITTVTQYQEFVRSIFGDQAERALDHYRVASDQDVPDMFAAVYADRGFNYPIDNLARAFVQSGVDVYRYVYAYRQGRTTLPPTHSEQTGVLMDNLPHAGPSDGEMADILARYWLTFAETGHPDVPGLPEWPIFSESANAHLKLDLPPSTGAHWRTDHIAFVGANRAD